MRERIGEVILHLSLNKKPLKNGKHMVYIRVQHKAANRYYSCHYEMTEKEWKRFEKYPEEGHLVMKTYHRFRENILTLLKDDDFSFTQLSRMINKTSSNGIIEYVQKYCDDMVNNKQPGSSTVYRQLLSMIKKFTKDTDLPISRINTEWCQNFISWIQNTRMNGPTTTNIRIMCLKAVLNKAIKDHLIKKNPMDGIKTLQSHKRNMTISDESMKKLLHATKEQIGEENWYYLNYWRAIYYGNGMNVADLLRLTPSNISENNDELTFVRHKTSRKSGKEVHVALIPELKDALDVIKGNGRHLIPTLDKCQPDSMKEFYKINNHLYQINTHLRTCCEILGIKEKVTTYTARHSFATRLLRAGVPIEYISEALGHTKISTTQNYLDGYTKEQRRINAELIRL